MTFFIIQAQTYNDVIHYQYNVQPLPLGPKLLNQPIERGGHP